MKYGDYEEIKSYNHVIDELQEENAKLRELVRHLYKCREHNTCTVCAVCDYAEDACDFEYNMRELGIEVW